MKENCNNITTKIDMGDIWREILSIHPKVSLNDLLKLSTDYSCHGCAS